MGQSKGVNRPCRRGPKKGTGRQPHTPASNSTRFTRFTRSHPDEPRPAQLDRHRSDSPNCDSRTHAVSPSSNSLISLFPMFTENRSRSPCDLYAIYLPSRQDAPLRQCVEGIVEGAQTVRHLPRPSVIAQRPRVTEEIFALSPFLVTNL